MIDCIFNCIHIMQLINRKWACPYTAVMHSKINWLLKGWLSIHIIISSRYYQSLKTFKDFYNGSKLNFGNYNCWDMWTLIMQDFLDTIIKKRHRCYKAVKNTFIIQSSLHVPFEALKHSKLPHKSIEICDFWRRKPTKICQHITGVYISAVDKII